MLGLLHLCAQWHRMRYRCSILPLKCPVHELCLCRASSCICIHDIVKTSSQSQGADPELVSRGGGAHVERPSPPLPTTPIPALLPSPVPSFSFPSLLPFPFPSLSLSSPPSPPLEEGSLGVLPRKILKF